MARTQRKIMHTAWEKAARRGQKRASAAHRLQRQAPVPDTGTWSR